MLITDNLRGKLVQRQAPLQIKLGEQTKNQYAKTNVRRYDAWALAASERSMLEPLQEVFGTEVTRTQKDWRLPMPSDHPINLALRPDSCAILNRRIDPASRAMIGDCDGETLNIGGRIGVPRACQCKANGVNECQISVTIEGRLYVDGCDLHPLVSSQNRSELFAEEFAPAAKLFTEAGPDDVVLVNLGFHNHIGQGLKRWDATTGRAESAAFVRLRINAMTLVEKSVLDQAFEAGRLGTLFLNEHNVTPVASIHNFPRPENGGTGDIDGSGDEGRVGEVTFVDYDEGTSEEVVSEEPTVSHGIKLF
jgi:hypothetical protein